jgi:hypothetical protein
VSAEKVRLHFLLEQDDEEDREEISEVPFEFAALQEHELDVDIETVRRRTSEIC